MDYSHQGNWFKPEDFNYPVHVIGCGAVGSFIALQLIKMGIKEIHVYDFDTVESHNVCNQVFLNEHIGMYKVEALYNLVKNTLAQNQKLFIHTEKAGSNHSFSGVVYMATDTMASRLEIWENCLQYKFNLKKLIEVRMGTRNGRIYTIDPMNVTEVNFYNKTFYTDEESERSVCGTSINIIPTAMYIASLAAMKVIKIYKEIPIKNEIHFDIENLNLISFNWTELKKLNAYTKDK